MKHASLFTGIGGFDLAAQWMGWENVFQVEIDKFCNKVLEKNFPNVKRYGDIKEFDGKEWRGTIDVLSGGPPCQPTSIAGKRKGTTDNRWLWPEAIRIFGEVRPRFGVFENPDDLLTLEDGEPFERICRALEDFGYKVETYGIPAACVEAWHERDRIWIIAQDINSIQCNGGERKEESKIRRFGKSSSGNNERIYYESDVADINSQGFQKSTCRELGSILETIGTSEGSESCGVYATDRKYRQVEPGLVRMVHGVSSELDFIKRLKNDERISKKSVTEINEIIWEALRSMWKYKDFAETSQNVYTHRIYNSLPEISQRRTYEGWQLGKGYKETEKLRCLWSSFYAKSFEEAQDLQQELLEYFRKDERRKKMERVERIKGLGNTIDPWVAFEIFKAIEQTQIL